MSTDDPIIITAEVKKQMEDDLRLFGNAFARRHPDGSVERLDPTRIIIVTRPRLVSSWGAELLKGLDDGKQG